MLHNASFSLKSFTLEQYLGKLSILKGKSFPNLLGKTSFYTDIYFFFIMNITTWESNVNVNVSVDVRTEPP